MFGISNNRLLSFAQIALVLAALLGTEIAFIANAEHKLQLLISVMKLAMGTFFLISVGFHKWKGETVAIPCTILSAGILQGLIALTSLGMLIAKVFIFHQSDSHLLISGGLTLVAGGLCVLASHKLYNKKRAA